MKYERITWASKNWEATGLSRNLPNRVLLEPGISKSFPTLWYSNREYTTASQQLRIGIGNIRKPPNKLGRLLC